MDDGPRRVVSVALTTALLFPSPSFGAAIATAVSAAKAPAAAPARGSCEALRSQEERALCEVRLSTPAASAAFVRLSQAGAGEKHESPSVALERLAGAFDGTRRAEAWAEPVVVPEVWARAVEVEAPRASSRVSDLRGAVPLLAFAPPPHEGTAGERLAAKARAALEYLRSAYRRASASIKERFAAKEPAPAAAKPAAAAAPVAAVVAPPPAPKPKPAKPKRSKPKAPAAKKAAPAPKPVEPDLSTEVRRRTPVDNPAAPPDADPKREEPALGPDPVPRATLEPEKTEEPPAVEPKTEEQKLAESASSAPAPAPVPAAEMPPFDPGRLGESLYDTICWAFTNGEHKGAIEAARKDVASAAREFGRHMTPSLSSALRQVFLQVEGGEGGAAFSIRADYGFGDWEKMGAASARFLHSVARARKTLGAALTAMAALSYRALGVELEAALLEARPQAAGSRLKALSAERESLKSQSKRVLGYELDLSPVVSDADRAYLAALAESAGDAFLADERAKAWLSKRVEEGTALIEAQIKRKTALEALKMAALAEKDELGADQRSAVEEFIQLTREGLSANDAAFSATQSPAMREAVAQSQVEVPYLAEAGSQVRLARALQRLAVYDVIPNLRVGIEEGWKEGQGVGAPEVGAHVRWTVTKALRLLWDGADLKVPDLEKDIAELGVEQARRDLAYNLERADAAVEQYEAKRALPGAYPDASEIGLYGVARHARSYAPEAPAGAEASTEAVVALSSFEDLLTEPAKRSPHLKAAELRELKAAGDLSRAGQRVNVDVGVGAGELVVDSVLPTLVVTLENLGRQKEAAQVRSLGASLRRAKAAFELTFALLHFSNDYLYALEKEEAAAEGPEKVAARYRVRQVEAELRRLMGPGVALPDRLLLESVFSRGDDKLYWGHPLLKHFNLDATLGEAAQRVAEDIADTEKALAAVPEVRLHLTSLMALIVSPAMPWMTVLAIMDGARTVLPLLSRVFTRLFESGKAKAERREKLAGVYGAILSDQKAAEALAESYKRQREDLRELGRYLPASPASSEERHQVNRWRIAALAFELAPGAEDFVADRVEAAVEAGDLEAAVGLWRGTHAEHKLEAGAASPAGERLRRALDSDWEFKRKLAEKILDSGDWFAVKLAFDSWLRDFDLDFGPELGGKIVKKIAKGYYPFYEQGGGDPRLDERSFAAHLKEVVENGEDEWAYELYRKQVRFERKKQEALAAGVPPDQALSLSASELDDALKQRALTRKIIALTREGWFAKAEELLGAAAKMYEEKGLDFDARYPGLKRWVVAEAANALRPKAEAGEGKPFSLELPEWLTLGAPESGGVPEPGRPWRSRRLVPEWDAAARYKSVTNMRLSRDPETGISESETLRYEDMDGRRQERRDYAFSGPMGPLGELRFHSGTTVPLEPEGRGDAYYSLSATQYSLVPGFGLTERLVRRVLPDGRERGEYGLGLSGYGETFSGYGDGRLITQDGETHYQSYGNLLYGRPEDPLRLSGRWQADDLYGTKPGQSSGEYNLGGRLRLTPLGEGRPTEFLTGGTYWHDRQYLTTGRYYDEMYTGELSRPAPGPEGTAAYAALRQTLVDGKYGGLSMGYAAQQHTGEDPASYRTVSYHAPGGKAQVDLINSDDPRVGPLAVQAQGQYGAGFARAGVDASSYTFVLGARDDDSGLSAAGRLSVGTRDADSRALGLVLGAGDASYQALWGKGERSFTLRQGDWWSGSGVEFDYRDSPYGGERYRFRMSLGALAGETDWSTWTPFAPLAKGVASLVRRLSAEEEKGPPVEEQLSGAPSKEELAKRSAGILEKAGERARQESGRADLLADAAAGLQDDRGDFGRELGTTIPYSWKPAFSEFLAALDELIPMLKLAREETLFGPSEAPSPAAVWTPRAAQMVDEVLSRYEAYRAARRDQIMAIPVSGGADKRPAMVAAFNQSSQWFVDYLRLIKAEFLELDRVARMSDEELQGQLARLYRLKEDKALDAAEVRREEAVRLLGPGEWLPTTALIPVRVLDGRIGRLLSETKRRQNAAERLRTLRSRAAERAGGAK